MKRDAKSKLSASVLVLVLALSALVLIPAGNTGQASTGKSIYVPVFSGGLPVSESGIVTLTEVHTGAVTTPVFQSSVSMYVASDAQSGYYRVDVQSANYFDALNAVSFRYDGYTNVTLAPITITKIPDKQWTWNVTVVPKGGTSGVSGVLVGFYSVATREFVSMATTNSIGVALVPMFTTTVFGDYVLAAQKIGFETNTTPVLVTGNNVLTMQMNTSLSYSAVVKNDSGSPALDQVSYLINTDPNVVWLKRVLKSTDRTYFDAYPGTFILVIDATGLAARVETVPISSSILTEKILGPQNQRTEQINIDFGADFNAFTLDVATEWSYDDPYPGLLFNDMGSLRTQIDLTLGNGDGSLSPTEVISFFDLVDGFGSQYVTSQNLMTVNQDHTPFTSAPSVTGFVLDLAAGLDNDTAGVNYAYQCAYTSHTAIPVLASKYSMNVTARLNSPNVEYNYTIPLVTDYELVHNLTGLPGTKVLGYLTVNITSNQLGTGTELITMNIEKSVKPNALGAVDILSVLHKTNTSVVKNATGVIQRYIVRENALVNFTSAESNDPNGNKQTLTYTWDFRDGSQTVTTRNTSVTHNFTAVFAQKFVNLTVTDVAGQTNSTEINVTCDGLDPRPNIQINKIPIVSNTIKVNQSQTVFMNATGSADDAATVGDGLGVIANVQYDFGDGNFTSKIENVKLNVTHSYNGAGNFKLVLTVTDVVGHSKNTTLTVHVNDTTAPAVSFTARNDTWGTTIYENTTVHFDASLTRDNLDNYTNMSYAWNLGDGTWQNGTGLFNVSHTYTRIGQGQLTASLKVTDLSNNTGSQAKVVNILSGPRPNVIIDKIIFTPQTTSPFSPGNMTAGKTGTILINLTNTGNFVANNVVVKVYIVPEGGGALQQIATGSSAQMYNGTQLVSSIEPGGKVQIRISYSPPNQGTFTIRVNVTSDNQLNQGTRLASGVDALHVKSSPLTTILLWVGVIVIIVAIPTLLYVRSRWSKREKKGPRRPERKEREPEEG